MLEHAAAALVVRKARKSDLATIWSVDKAAFGNICNDYVTIRQLFDIAGECFFVGELDGSVIAYAVGCSQFACDSGWLLDVAVHPELQGNGYGHSLVKVVIETLINAGISSIRLTVKPGNKAIGLYEKLGFREESREANYFGKDERVVMLLSLTPIAKGNS